MTLIEGIGDEVLQFFILFLFISIVIFAWFTTNTANDGNFRTVFLLERRRIRAARRLTTQTESSTIAEGTSEENSEPNNQPNPAMEPDKPDGANSDTERNGASSEETRIVAAMDAPDSSESQSLRRRINLNVNPDVTTTNLTSNDHENTSCDASQNDTARCLDGEPGCSKVKEEDKIHIKLKFINDELRRVEASLREKIGDFKRQHFQVELGANKIVKLIFNGHILERDLDTLGTCGLFDDCVVHCVIITGNSSQVRGSSAHNRSDSASVENDLGSDNRNLPNEWHLENYLLTILLLLLAAAWYLRCVYSQIYTVTATIGLILMTGIFTIVMFGMRFPDNLELNQQPVENVGT